MAGILRMSEGAGLALHTMAMLAGQPGRRLRRHEVSEALGASDHTLAKVLQQLRKVGLLRSVSGPRGGFTLARPATQINMLEVYEAIDGALNCSQCVLAEGECRQDQCILGGLVASVHQQVARTFSQTNMEQLAASMGFAAPTTA